MNAKQQNSRSTGEEENVSALMTNANAIRVIAQAVEGTIGPKGLDTMLMDQFGDVVITNDGVTILELMDINHPAARLLINIAKAQQVEIGDGTTTATILAGALVNEGVNQVMKGVPVIKVIEGMRLGIGKALQVFESRAQAIDELDEPVLRDVARVAARENEDIAELVTQAAQVLGKENCWIPALSWRRTSGR